MNNDVSSDIIDAIILEVILNLPNELLHFYGNIPGRNPSDHHRQIAAVIKTIDNKDALSIIRDVADSCVFAILNLIDSDFKDKSIETSFNRSHKNAEHNDTELAEYYRAKVNPGGLINIG